MIQRGIPGVNDSVGKCCWQARSANLSVGMGSTSSATPWPMGHAGTGCFEGEARSRQVQTVSGNCARGCRSIQGAPVMESASSLESRVPGRAGGAPVVRGRGRQEC